MTQDEMHQQEIATSSPFQLPEILAEHLQPYTIDPEFIKFLDADELEDDYQVRTVPQGFLVTLTPDANEWLPESMQIWARRMNEILEEQYDEAGFGVAYVARYNYPENYEGPIEIVVYFYAPVKELENPVEDYFNTATQIFIVEASPKRN